MLCREHSEVTISAVLYLWGGGRGGGEGSIFTGSNVFQQGPINLELILFYTTVIQFTFCHLS